MRNYYDDEPIREERARLRCAALSVGTAAISSIAGIGIVCASLASILDWQLTPVTRALILIAGIVGGTYVGRHEWTEIGARRRDEARRR